MDNVIEWVNMISEAHPLIFTIAVILLYTLIGLIFSFIYLAIIYIKEGKAYSSIESFVERNMDECVGFIFAWPIVVVVGICAIIIADGIPAMMRSFLLLFGDKTTHYNDYSEDDWRN